MKRHLARMANTDQRVVVVFMQIPGKEDHALIVATDNLPPRWEQFLMQVVESPEGQGDPDLGNVLGRRLMPDTTETLLQALHSAGLLRSVPINNVIMFPEPNRPFALRQILQAMGRILPDEYAAVDQMNETKTEKVSSVGQQKTPVDPFAKNGDTKFNPHTSNQEATASENSIGIARSLLIEADMLEADAKAKREKAYTFAPHLRPQIKTKKAVAPAPVAEVQKPVAKVRAAPTRAPASKTKTATKAKPKAKASV